MKKIKLYVDESGNSGPNYLDKDKPYFILAAYLDLDGKMDRLENVERIKAILNYEEGKNYSLIKSVAGRKKMKNVLSFMREMKCIPFIAIANKKYCISNRIVEVLLDPVYNSMVPMEIDLPQNYSIKKELSNRIFCNLSEELLFDFSKGYRGNGMSLEERIHNMRELIVTISNELERKDAFIANMIRGAINDIENNMRDEEKEESSRLAEQAPNLWLLYNLLLLVENQFRETDYVVDVVHDVQVKYDSHIQTMYEFIDTHEFMNQLYHIGEINFSDSKSDVRIQAADILAGSVNMILKCKHNNWRDDQSFSDIFEIVWPYILDFGREESHTAYIENENHFSEVCEFYK